MTIKYVRIPQEAPNLAVWRYFVLQRDKLTCQWCGYHGHLNNTLEAHHKSKKRIQRLRIANGETLCRKCHRITKLVKPKNTRNRKWSGVGNGPG